MPHPRVKICGITTVDDALLAARLGADAIGLNFYAGSKRYVSPAHAVAILQALPPLVEPVALFVNVPLADAVDQAQQLGMRTIQWHGNSVPLPVQCLCRYVPAFAIANADNLANVAAFLGDCRAFGRLPDAVLLDGHASGQFGGTGQTAPWQLLADFEPGVPVILAGGLTPDNVAEAIRTVRPYAVDVASGVESSTGKKDPELLRRFIDAVRSAQAIP